MAIYIAMISSHNQRKKQSLNLKNSTKEHLKNAQHYYRDDKKQDCVLTSALLNTKKVE